MTWNRKRGESQHDYALWLFNSNKHYIRNLLLLYMSFYPLFAVIEHYGASGSFFSSTSTLLISSLPFLLVAYISTFVKRYTPYIRIINATALLGMSISILSMYASLSPYQTSFNTYYSSLIITIATLGLSMSSKTLICIYISLSACTFILISSFVHKLYLIDMFLFVSSTTYVIVASGLFMVAGIVIERFSLKLYKAQKNISQEKEKITQQKDNLENLNQTKDRFFSIISHDLRSPFTALIGYFDVLLRNEKNEFKVKKSDIEKIYLHTRRTYNLLNNLLSWSKAQLNQYVFEPKQYFLNEIFSENRSLYREIAKQKEIKIIHSFPNGAQVYCDKDMVITIIRNLIFNAIKYTKTKGEIFVTAKQLSENEMEIAIIDNGIGISKEDIKMILSPNTHITKKGTHNEKGAGIGLIICNDILKMHHSKIQIESRKNVGSKFFFIIPIHADNEKNKK
ncbi:sensor histidine kinase [Saccharicrinis fermentans]|uniref:histidine kinase n=1 Tax=Saccharicrinis fermentans DSM 9555 = JCM 21142 TaxID=869213 RepID=W7Y3Q4_9BACT|nr:HAMP domain-containing sensor histidine kinase [Saccharicrinis fermentans]GAF05505.1 signal-transduction histidine kinase SenX3 [Saccharicrinis fermentans DSM 9555 = JCM 21142]